MFMLPCITCSLTCWQTATLKGTNKGGGSAHGGAGGGDAYTEHLIRERKEDAEDDPRDCREAGPIKMRMPRMPRGPKEVVVDGTYMPNGLMLTHGDMAYALNQAPGKLRIKDIKVRNEQT